MGAGCLAKLGGEDCDRAIYVTLDFTNSERIMLNWINGVSFKSHVEISIHHFLEMGKRERLTYSKKIILFNRGLAVL